MRVIAKKRSGLSVAQNMIVTTLIILFFLGVILSYYAMLYSQTRANIINNGELNAVKAANQINRHLSTGSDAIKLTGYTLDNMIRDKRSQEEIQAYIEDQSFATAIVLAAQSNGIYGYINGEYLDGVRWVPDEDYVATERPWYVEAMARSGKVVVIDPYIDAQTGAMILTFAKTLCDAKSVVAIDISMEELQTLTENVTTSGNTDMEIVLDHSYQVISHSDMGEVGKNYLREKGTFGSAIVEQLREQAPDENYFSVEYDNAEYIVYAMSIENDWVCLSVTNATTAFDQIRILLVLTIIVSALIIAILLVIMIRSNRKEALAEKMKQLADQQTEYAYNDQLTGLKNRRAYSEIVAQLSGELPTGCRVIMFDVNRLKTVNDTLGHEAGDELIRAAAECIRACFEGVEAVFRLGGDEFCLIMTGAEETARQCLEELERRAAAWKGQYIDGFSISYGMASDGDCPDIEAIVKEADRRMYDYKRSFYSLAGNDRRRSD